MAARPTQHRSVVVQPFGRTAVGAPVALYELRGPPGGPRARVSTYGATLVSLALPDAAAVGGWREVCLGFDDLEGYRRHQRAYCGAVVGRCANRIAHARFRLGNATYHLPANDPPHSLHGGSLGFDQRVWAAALVPGAEPAVRFSLLSPAGDQGYPGALRVGVTYALPAGQNTLRILCEATTDAPTVVNLTHHAYFNLAGAGQGTILDHRLQIEADHYTPLDPTQVPTGEIRPVAGRVVDFRRLTLIGARRDVVEPGANPVRYNENFVLNGPPAPGAGLPGWRSPPAAAGSKCAPTSPPSSSTRVTSWTASKAAPAGPTSRAAGSAWNPRGSPTHPTNRGFPRSCCTRATSTGPGQITPLASPRQERVVPPTSVNPAAGPGRGNVRDWSRAAS